MGKFKNSTTKTSFKLQELIEESLYAFKQKEKYKRVSLHLIDDLVSPLSIKTDRKKLKKVFEVLLVNAVDLVKATKIIVSLKQLLKTENEVLLEFTVEDNGAKNSSGFTHSLYPYKRSLVIIRSMIEEFDGKAEISSLEGVGTTVKFLVKFSWEDAPQEITASHSRLAGKKILVAEDNEINQKIIAHLLKKENIQVDIANDGKEAVELMEKKTYDLLLVDLQMPHMDGFQTANYIRKKLKNNIPIIAMTAGAFANEQIRCFEVGINQYLSKPFSPEDLFQRLKYFLLNEHYLKLQKSTGPTSTQNSFSLDSLKHSNDEDQIIEILEMFVTTTPGLLKEIKWATEHQEFNEVIKKIAKLKGSLGSLEMQSMLRISDDIELFIRMENIPQIPVAVEQLRKEYETIAPLLNKELSTMKVKSVVR